MAKDVFCEFQLLLRISLEFWLIYLFPNIVAGLQAPAFQNFVTPPLSPSHLLFNYVQGAFELCLLFGGSLSLFKNSVIYSMLQDLLGLSTVGLKNRAHNQCVIKKYSFKRGGRAKIQFTGNLCLKITSKLRGKNRTLHCDSWSKIMKLPIMIVGADVT